MNFKPVTREIILSSGIMMFPLLAVGADAGKSTSKTSPNVIYILADDLGIGDLGCYGQKIIRTPGIDNLAANGMRFTQHYSGSTVSAPSRCVLLTGKHTGHAYIRGNKGSRNNADGIDYDLSLAKNEVTVAEIFKEKQYQTACIGKWGLGGPNSQGHPNNQGFDYFFGYLGQGLAHKYYPKQLYENNTAVQLDGKVYSHDLIMEKALDFVNKNASKPFFLYLTPTIPHAELIVPEGELMGYDGMFPEKPFVQKSGSYCSQPKPRATFAAMVSRLDRDVQRIVDLLEEKGIANNTLIIFTSDNGTHKEGGHDPEFFDSNGPFRGYKRDLYEGGIRTPHIAYWPGVIPKASVSYHISAFWDFLPTMAELIGVKTPKGVDGISYLPALTGKGEQKQHSSLYFEFHEQGGRQSIMKDGWKLIRLNVSTPDKSTLELYNYFEDPGEMANVATQYPEKVKELKALMDKQRIADPNWNFVKVK